MLVGAIVLLAMGAREVLASTPNCAGTGHVNDGVKSMSCAGTCPPPADPADCQAYVTNGIPSGRGVYPAGHPKEGEAYAFCKCPEEGESSCCHLVGDLNRDETRITAFDVVGDCPSCPTTGACETKVVTAGVQAVCE